MSRRLAALARALLLLPMPAHAADKARPASKAQIERGRYLVAFAACSDCHTPMKIDPATHSSAPDMSHFLAGHPEGAGGVKGKLAEGDAALIDGTLTAFALPFGTVYAPNLTPDRDTGPGTWTVDMFIQAMRSGRHLGQGRAILPPMPWYGLAGLTTPDLRAVFAYLRTVPAVHNAVAESQVPAAVLAGIAKDNEEILKHVIVPKGR